MIHAHLEQYDQTEVKQAGFDYLELLLHKLGLSTAATELRLNVPTLHRIIDRNRPIESINYLTAAYIVFMCETNARILRIMDKHPRGTAYYKRNELA